MLRPKVTQVLPIANYRLWLTFETGEVKFFNVGPYIDGDWFGKLRDAEYFKTVRISGGTVAWKDGQDIAPHELYDLSVNTNNDI